MKNKIPTAEEFCKNYTRLRSAMAIQDLIECMNEYAKLHVKAALEAAAENVCMEHEEGSVINPEGDWYINKKSILNSYPENLII